MEEMQSENKKRLKDYLLEGLMIFVAVTLGFFAESIRENMNDRKKEREYVASLISNLEKDTAQFKSVISDTDKNGRSLRRPRKPDVKTLGKESDWITKFY